MRCARCDKRIREVYYVNGKPYGIKCAKRRGYSDKKVIIKKSTDDEYQIDMFEVNNDLQKDRFALHNIF